METILVTAELINAVAQSVGTSRGGQGYLYEFDVDQDGQIDMGDLGYFARNLGLVVALPEPPAQVDPLAVVAAAVVGLVLGGVAVYAALQQR